MQSSTQTTLTPSCPSTSLSLLPLPPLSLHCPILLLRALASTCVSSPVTVLPASSAVDVSIFRSPPVLPPSVSVVSTAASLCRHDSQRPMSHIPALRQTADFLTAALLSNQHNHPPLSLPLPPQHSQPQSAEQSWMAGHNNHQQPHNQPQPQRLHQHQPHIQTHHQQQQQQQHQRYQQQQPQKQPMDVTDVGTSTATAGDQSLSLPSSSLSVPSTPSQPNTPSPPLSRSSLSHPPPPTPQSTVYSSAASHSYHLSPQSYSSTYPPPQPPHFTSASPTLSGGSDAGSPPPSGHWSNASRLPLPSMSSLSRSASSSLPSSSTSVSSAMLQSTPPPPRQHRRNMGPPMSLNVSPATPHSLGVVSLHSSSPIASPDLPPLHPNSALAMPSPAPLQHYSASGASQLPPFHPPSSSPTLHPSPSVMSHPAPAVFSPPTLQIPITRGQSASSSSAPNSPTPLQHHIPSCTLSLDGQFQDANPAFLATFRFFTLPALLQHSIYAIVHPNEHLSFMVMMRRIMTGKVKSLAQEKLCVPLSHGGSPSRPIPMWLMMSAVTLDEKLLTLYCCFLPKPRREENDEAERESVELRLELEGRAQLQQTQLELQDEMLRIEKMYQQQFAALNQQQHRYGITQQMIDQYSATAASQQQTSTTSSTFSFPPPTPPRDPSQMSLSGLPKPQQLHLQQLQQTNNELKVLQGQHTAKLTRFMQLLARQSPFQAALGSAGNTLFAPSTLNSRSHTAPSTGGSAGIPQHLMTSDPSRMRTGSEPGDWSESSGDDNKISALASPTSTMSATSSVSLPHIRSFSQSFASTAGVDTPSPFSDSPYSRASSALLSSSTSSAV